MCCSSFLEKYSVTGETKIRGRLSATISRWQQTNSLGKGSSNSGGRYSAFLMKVKVKLSSWLNSFKLIV